MAAVAAATDIAIGADEGIHSLDDIKRHHEHKAARGVSLKAIKLGGIRAVVEAGRLCERLGMSVNISCKTGESSIACAAALHVASVIPNIAWGLTLTHTALGEDVTAQPVADRERPCRKPRSSRASASMSTKTACAATACRSPRATWREAQAGANFENSGGPPCGLAACRPNSPHMSRNRATSSALLLASRSRSNLMLSSSPVRRWPPSSSDQRLTSN